MNLFRYTNRGLKINYKTLLFDLDNTLVDFSNSESLSLKNLYQNFFSSSLRWKPFSALYHQINQPLWKQVENKSLTPSQVKTQRFKELLEHLECVHPTAPHLATFFEEQLALNTSWLPNVAETLDLLRKQFSIGIITNGLSSVQRKKYENTGLSQWCSCYLISEELGISKPEKAIFSIALDQTKSSPESTLMIGDSLSGDYQGAINASLDFCWINPHEEPLPPQYPPPRYEVRSVAELPNVLKL